MGAVSSKPGNGNFKIALSRAFGTQARSGGVQASASLGNPGCVQRATVMAQGEEVTAEPERVDEAVRNAWGRYTGVAWMSLGGLRASLSLTLLNKFTRLRKLPCRPSLLE
eukprot:11258122-Alexandrium_andersonii.AAC.1